MDQKVLISAKNLISSEAAPRRALDNRIILEVNGSIQGQNLVPLLQAARVGKKRENDGVT